MTDNSNNTSSVYDYSDYTNTEENSIVQPFQVFVASLYSIVFIIGIIGNILVLWVLFKSYRGRIWKFFGTQKCIFHIALADLLLLISLPFWAYDAMAEWIFGSFMCRTVTALYMLGLYGTVFFMVLIIVNEYLHFFHLFIYRNTITSNSACFVWILSLLASLPNVIFTREIQGPYRTVCVHDFPSPAWRSFTFLNMNLLSFIIPLIIIVFCYLRFCVSLERMIFRFKNKLKTMLAVVVVYFLFWAPYNIALFLIILQTNGYLPTIEWSDGLNLAMQWVEIVAYIHCSLNPIIYVLFEPNFRRRVINSSIVLASRFPISASQESSSLSH